MSFAIIGFEPTPWAAAGAPPAAPVIPQGRDPLSFLFYEYQRLSEEGQAPDLTAFCADFPCLQHDLECLLQLEGAANEDPSWVQIGEPPWPVAGQLFVGFLLERELGRGAFSRVYLAREAALGDRPVVAKVSPLGNVEAITQGRLAHPNIVPVYSVHHDPRTRRSVVCMPYLGEATLSDVLVRVKSRARLPRRARVLLETARRGRAPEPTPDGPGSPGAPETERLLQCCGYVDGIRHLAVQLLDALEFMHGEGVLHRDLKPSNILLTRCGVPMLLDFNLSADDRQEARRPGGTPTYAPPEQLRLVGDRNADGSHLDGRADLFSLGVILYEMLTGRFPFALPETKVTPREFCRFLLEQQAAGARPVRDVNAQVDAALADLVDRCLAFTPERRPATAAAARALLVAPAPANPAWGAVKRYPRLSAAVLTLACAGAAWAALAAAIPAPSELAQGQAAYRAGAYQTAMDHFSQRLAQTADDRDALFGRGMAHLRLHQYTLAANDLVRAQDVHADGATWATLGYALQKTEQQHAACTEYERAIAAGYKTAAVCNNLGYAYLKTNLLAQAEAALTEAVHLDADLAAAYVNRGMLYVHRSFPAKAGRTQWLERAGVDLKTAIAKGPASGELYRHTAEVYAHLAVNHAQWRHDAAAYLALALEHGTSRDLLERKPFDKLKGAPPIAAAVQRQASAQDETRIERVVPIISE